jgi:glycosyltransferase involved in cell wall biosynthesis
MESTIIKKQVTNNALKILFSGWTQIAHSYAIVNCFQLIHLYKNYGPNGVISKNKLDIYIEECDYYRPEWNNKKKLVYNTEYNEIIKNFKLYNGEKVDLIYRMTYPYNITVSETNVDVPKCIFYTSEFREYLTKDYFTVAVPPNVPLSDNYITSYLNQFNNIYFTSPSDWSSKGLVKYNVSETRNRIITHGVDTTIFKRDHSNRNKIREKYGILDNDILLLSMGACTTNKGIILILQILNILVHQLKRTHYKLLLKGTGDLYQCKEFLEQYFDTIVKAKAMTQSEINNLYENHIIFTDKTLSFSLINDLYNSADLYISPFLAEGFGMTILEAVAAGCDILLPMTGSTKEYAELIYNNGGSEFIHYTKSKVVTLENGMSQNQIELQDLLNTMISFESKLQERRTNGDKRDYNKMVKFIEKELSWNKVSELLVDYFEDIIFHKI